MPHIISPCHYRDTHSILLLSHPIGFPPRIFTSSSFFSPSLNLPPLQSLNSEPDYSFQMRYQVFVVPKPGPFWVVKVCLPLLDKSTYTPSTKKKWYQTTALPHICTYIGCVELIKAKFLSNKLLVESNVTIIMKMILSNHLLGSHIQVHSKISKTLKKFGPISHLLTLQEPRFLFPLMKPLL